MALAYRHPAVQWVSFGPSQISGEWAVECAACGTVELIDVIRQNGHMLIDQAGVNEFASEHREHTSAAQSHYGLGDVFASMTKAVGAEPCTPCEARRRAMNEMLPKVWPRR